MKEGRIPLPEEVRERLLESPRIFSSLFSVHIPPEMPRLKEIDCLELNRKLRTVLLRAKITKISQLLSKSDELPYKKGIGPKFLEELNLKIQVFRQKVLDEQAKNPGKKVIIEVSPPILTPRREEIIGLARKWRKERPKEKGMQIAIAQSLNLSKTYVGKVVNQYRRETGDKSI